MARNILFITLFIALYGTLFLLGTSGGDEITDRNGFGEFSENHYSCEACGFEMDFKSDWIPLDGKAIANSYSDRELTEYFGEPGSYDIITGFSSPALYMECVRYNNISLGSEYFTSTYLQQELDYCKENISLAGGTLSGCGSYVMQAQGNGSNMAVYYYDYYIGDEFYSELNCFVNCGKDTIWLYGYYLDKEGLSEMMDFLNSNIRFTSPSEQTI